MHTYGSAVISVTPTTVIVPTPQGHYAFNLVSFYTMIKLTNSRQYWVDCCTAMLAHLDAGVLQTIS